MGDAHLIADETVISRAVASDRDALGELWRIYHPQLLRFLRTKRTQAVDDVASQVWIDVGRSIGGFVGDGRQFQRWIFTIAHRRSVDEVRRSARRLETSIDPLAHDVFEGREEPSPDADTDAAVELMATLPPQMAEAVMLRIVYQLSVEETASVMSTTAANVRVLTHRGLAKLRLRLRRARSTAGARDRDAILEVRAS